MDRPTFYNEVRKTLFNGALTQAQVAGTDAILDVWNSTPHYTNTPFLAYVLATAYHETGRSMQPVIETQRANDLNRPSVDTAIRRLDTAYATGKLKGVKRTYWRKDANGRSWLGRGHTQVTHEENYARVQALSKFPIHDNPDLMFDLKTSASIHVMGMLNGWWTGKKLSDYQTARYGYDYEDARRIVNGTDKAREIAAYAKKFEEAIRLGWAAKRDAPIPAPTTTTPPPDVEPPAPAAPTTISPPAPPDIEPVPPPPPPPLSKKPMGNSVWVFVAAVVALCVLLIFLGVSK
jgi:hypothetical protein